MLEATGVSMTKVFLYALAVVIALAVVDLAFCWMERRGWLYWRKKRRFPDVGGVRGAMGVFQEICQPEIRHVYEDRDQREAARGDTPDDGK